MQQLRHVKHTSWEAMKDSMSTTQRNGRDTHLKVCNPQHTAWGSQDLRLNNMLDYTFCRRNQLGSSVINVTKAARKDLVETIVTIRDLCNAVHHIQNPIGDINKVPKFKFVRGITFCNYAPAAHWHKLKLMSMLKGIVKNFSKLCYGTTVLRMERYMEKISL